MQTDRLLPNPSVLERILEAWHEKRGDAFRRGRDNEAPNVVYLGAEAHMKLRTDPRCSQYVEIRREGDYVLGMRIRRVQGDADHVAMFYSPDEVRH